MRIVYRPQFRVLDGEGCRDALRAMSRHLNRQELTQGGLQLCAVNDNGRCTFFVRLILDGYLHLNSSLVGRNLRCRHKNAILGNVQGRHRL